jgi:uncharacterized protein (DUF885 family)
VGPETSGQQGQEARTLVDRYWDDLLRLDPLLATEIGDHRFDELLPDPSERGRAAAMTVHRSLLEDLAHVRRDELEPAMVATLDIAESVASNALSSLTHRLDRLHLVDHLLGPTSLPGDLAAIVKADTGASADRYVARLGAIAPYLAVIVDELDEAMTAGIVPPTKVTDRVIGQLRRLLATPPDETPFRTPVAGAPVEVRTRVSAIVRDEVLPAYGRYLDAVAGHRPNTRPMLGLVSLPDGERLYAACIRRWTSLDIDPAGLHRRGREELARINEGRTDIVRRLGLDDVESALGAADRAMRRKAVDRASVLALATSYVERGWEGSKPFFVRMPPANCDVRLVEPFREPDYPGAFYHAPAEGRGGLFYVNASFYLDPDSRLLHRLATTSYHEANPGHHFQIAVEQARRDLPALRRFAGSIGGDVFTEGWALYAERLADEIGLYEDDHERLGLADNEILRAARLIVDTGLHAYGWSRDQAIGELVAAGLPRAEAEIEVDRYAVDPGQALCYKVGELEIRRLRGRFSDGTSRGLAVFHDRLLDLGALPFASLERELGRLYAGDAVNEPSG